MIFFEENGKGFANRSALCYKLFSLGQIPKWSKGADCKSAGYRLRGFKSLSAHHSDEVCQRGCLAQGLRKLN